MRRHPGPVPPSADAEAGGPALAPTPASQRSRVRRRWALVTLMTLAAFTATTARLFVWPSLPALPDRADAIVERPVQGTAMQ